MVWTLIRTAPAAACATPGWSPSDTATVLAAGIGALVAVGLAACAYISQQRANRQERRLTIYAEALRAVADYLEAPYIIRRRDGTAEARQAITGRISEIQSRMAFYDAWLELHADKDTHQAFTDYVAAARFEAGTQMTDAWNEPPTTHDADVPLGVSYAHPRCDATRASLLARMKAAE